MNWKPMPKIDYLTYKAWQQSPVGQKWQGYLLFPYTFTYGMTYDCIASCQFYDKDYIRMDKCIEGSFKPFNKEYYVMLTIKKLSMSNTRVDITGKYNGKTKHFDYNRWTGAVGLWKDKTGFEIKWTSKDQKCKQFRLYAYTHKEYLQVMDYSRNPLYTVKKPDQKRINFEFVMKNLYKK